MLYHIRMDLPLPGIVQRVVGHGEYAVDLFFVMSGFVLALSYGPLFQRPSGLPTALRFLGYRLARIYPLHACVLAAYLLVPLAYAGTGRVLPTDRFHVGYFAASTLLAQNWGLFPTIEWNVPAWSISAELMFYLAFPLIALGISWVEQGRARLALVGGILLAAIGTLGYEAGGLVAFLAHTGPLRCLGECTLGMWLLGAARAWQPGQGGSAVLAAVAAGLVAFFGAGWAPDYAVMPLAMACFLWAVLEPGPLARVLSGPLLLWLGRASFATYIVHYLIKDVVKLLFVGHTPDSAALALYLAAVLTASAVLHRWVERPGQRAGQRLTEALLARLPVPPLATEQPR